MYVRIYMHANTYIHTCKNAWMMHPLTCLPMWASCLQRTAIHTYIHTYVRTCMKSTWIYACTHSFINIKIMSPANHHTYIQSYMHTYMQAYMYAYMHTFICMYIYVYICTHTHTHICTYTHTHTHSTNTHVYIYILTHLPTWTSCLQRSAEARNLRICESMLCIYMCLYTYVYVFACIVFMLCVYMCLYTYVYVFACIVFMLCIYMCLYTYVCVCVCMYRVYVVCIRMCMCLHVTHHTCIYWVRKHACIYAWCTSKTTKKMSGMWIGIAYIIGNCGIDCELSLFLSLSSTHSLTLTHRMHMHIGKTVMNTYTITNPASIYKEFAAQSATLGRKTVLHAHTFTNPASIHTDFAAQVPRHDL
jgi:hypothetical protein